MRPIYPNQNPGFSKDDSTIIFLLEEVIADMERSLQNYLQRSNRNSSFIQMAEYRIERLTDVLAQLKQMPHLLDWQKAEQIIQRLVARDPKIGYVQIGILVRFGGGEKAFIFPEDLGYGKYT